MVLKNNDVKLVEKLNDQAVTTSIIVSDTFGKRHDNVLRDIESLKKDVLNFEEMFTECQIKDAYGRNRKAYYMNKDGFTLLVMGYTGKKAVHFKLAYINQFNEMEKQLQSPFGKFENMIPTNMTEALQLALDQQKQLEKQEPMVDYYKKSMHNPSLMTMTVIAKDYGLSAHAMNEILHELGVIYQQSGVWVLYSKYADKGYAQFDDWNNEDFSKHRSHLKWTQRGKKFIHDLLLEKKGWRPRVQQMSLEVKLNNIRKENSHESH